ncbi:MAG: PEP-CTERM sorting domain-containing protein [Methylomonas sp.]|nr:PEP-CTERM sorting domain-containing protein [Methylomonas sp.]
MRFSQPLLAAGLLLNLCTLDAEASLTAYNAAGNTRVVYSSLGNITWTGDANLLGTLEASNPGLVSAIISTIGSISDTPNDYDTPRGSNSGIHTLSTADFGENGLVTWFGAQAFTKYLNSINYAGRNQWRLPSVTDTGTAGCNLANSGTDCGHNVDTDTGELAKLYYDELGKIAYADRSGASPQSGYGIFGNNGKQIAGGAVGPFTNAESHPYWIGTESASNPNYAWNFFAGNGYQSPNGGKVRLFYAWAASPGQVPAVPVPGAVWLFGTGLLGLLGLKRRQHVG